MRRFIETVKELNGELEAAIKNYKALIALEKETLELEQKMAKKWRALSDRPYQNINKYGRVTSWKVVD